MFLYNIAIILTIYGFILLFYPFYNIFCQFNGYFVFQDNFLLLFIFFEFLNFYIDFISFFLDINFYNFYLFKEFKVRFLAETINFDSLYFNSLVDSIWLRVGHPVLIFFEICNDSYDFNYKIYSLYNVTPTRISIYFHKIHCFCFEEQIVKSRSCYFLPIFFYIDEAIYLDFNMNYIDIITLTYFLI
jgi:cytochrome c oxidase assembly protein Cox11